MSQDITLSGVPRDETRRLDDPWPSLRDAPRVSNVCLAHLAGDVSMMTLRKFFHRSCGVLKDQGTVSWLAYDPDFLRGLSEDVLWPGEEVMVQGRAQRFIPLRQMFELARLFPLRMRTPCFVSDDILLFRAMKLPIASARKQDESYGPKSPYRRFNRMAEPEVLDDLLGAVARMVHWPGHRVLSLGVNDGREWELFEPFGKDRFEFYGVDHLKEAIDEGRRHFPDKNYTFIHADLKDLSRLSIPPCDMILMLNTLQCTDVDRESFFKSLKGLMSPHCRILISLPNCHFGSEDILRRPLDRLDPRSDRSAMYRDMRALARHFYRAGFSSIESYGTYDSFLLIRKSAMPRP